MLGDNDFKTAVKYLNNESSQQLTERQSTIVLFIMGLNKSQEEFNQIYKPWNTPTGRQ